MGNKVYKESVIKGCPPVSITGTEKGKQFKGIVERRKVRMLNHKRESFPLKAFTISRTSPLILKNKRKKNSSG